MIEFKIDKINSMKISDINTSDVVMEFDNVNGVVVTDIEESSKSKETLKFTNEVTFIAESATYQPSLWYTDPLGDRPCYIEYDIPILIQARWHKKKRINKKWLKRYGMKKDNVLVRCDVDSINQNVDNEYENESSYCPKFTEIGITLSNMQYKFRPDQLRKNLKIEVAW